MSGDVVSELGIWQPHMIPTNTLLLRSSKSIDNRHGYKLYQPEYLRPRVNHHQDILFYHSRQWPVQRAPDAKIRNVSPNLNSSSRATLDYAVVSEVKSIELIESLVKRIREQANCRCNWQPSSSPGTSLFNLGCKVDNFCFRDPRAENICKGLETELARTITDFRHSWTQTALLYGPLGALHAKLSHLHTQLQHQEAIGLRELELLDREIVTLPGDWTGEDVCSRCLLCVRERLSHAKDWLLEEGLRRERYLLPRSRIFGVLVTEFQGHWIGHDGMSEDLKPSSRITLDEYMFITTAKKYDGRPTRLALKLKQRIASSATSSPAGKSPSVAEDGPQAPL